MPAKYPKTVFREVYWRVRDVQGLPMDFERKPISKPGDVKPILDAFFSGQPKERFLVIAMNSRNVPEMVEVVSEGSMVASVVHPREVFRAAVVHLCSGIIVAHNHPSGTPEPSGDDAVVTQNLVNAGKTLGIQVLDHVIYADGQLVSLAERGMV